MQDDAKIEHGAKRGVKSKRADSKLVKFNVHYQVPPPERPTKPEKSQKRQERLKRKRTADLDHAHDPDPDPEPTLEDDMDILGSHSALLAIIFELRAENAALEQKNMELKARADEMWELGKRFALVKREASSRFIVRKQ